MSEKIFSGHFFLLNQDTTPEAENPINFIYLFLPVTEP